MSQPVNPLKRRGRPPKRNKSSPLSRISKKHRTGEFDSSYSEIDSFCEIESDNSVDTADNRSAIPRPTSSTPVTARKPIMSGLTEFDIELLSNKLCDKLKKPLAAELKDQIIIELKGQIVSEIKSELKSLVATQVSLATQTLSDQIEHLKLENESLKSEIKVSQNESRTIKQDNTKLACDIDELDQYSRRMCLDIFNIPGDSGDPKEDVEHHLLSLAAKVPLDITSADIDRCHRRGRYTMSKNRRIIIKFTNSKARQRVWDARKQLGDGIFVGETLTPYRENLAYQARQLTRGPERKLDRSWVVGGRIHGIMTRSQKKITIRDCNDIDSIKSDTTPSHTPMD